MAWSTTGTEVCVSKQTTSSILFAASGQTTIYQRETDVTTETRGLTEAVAKGMADAAAGDDTTVEATYYAHINGTTYSFKAITSGSRKEKGSARRDESGQWVYTETVRTFSTTAISNLVWGTTPLDADGNAITLSSTGSEVMVSVDKSVSRLAWDVFQTVTTTVKEYRRVDTQAHAEAIVSAAASATNVTQQTVYRHQIVEQAGQADQDLITAWVTFMSGTEKFASARYVSAAEGWTVTVTQKDYGWSSPNAAASGNGWRTSL
ncbi:MAG: hypothetical protein IJG13_07075 [Kiritimatiellae bacterium]|nr:hypothetical protein [Kiritimatiellia bacterium]MBQ3340950.1 hypothetical protein [Kiritimatiellia bacterium]